MIKKVTRTREYIPEEDASPEQKWVYSIVNRAQITPAKLSNICHVTRQAISNIMLGKTRLTFPMICAICYATGLDDPKEIYYTICQDGAVNKWAKK